MRAFFKRLLFRILFRRDVEMVEDFIGKFPGKCLICSYHRYGFVSGYIGPNDVPPPHNCIEKKAGGA